MFSYRSNFRYHRTATSSPAEGDKNTVNDGLHTIAYISSFMYTYHCYYPILLWLNIHMHVLGHLFHYLCPFILAQLHPLVICYPSLYIYIYIQICISRYMCIYIYTYSLKTKRWHLVLCRYCGTSGRSTLPHHRGGDGVIGEMVLESWPRAWPWAGPGPKQVGMVGTVGINLVGLLMRMRLMMRLMTMRRRRSRMTMTTETRTMWWRISWVLVRDETRLDQTKLD